MIRPSYSHANKRSHGVVKTTLGVALVLAAACTQASRGTVLCVSAPATTASSAPPLTALSQNTPTPLDDDGPHSQTHYPRLNDPAEPTFEAQWAAMVNYETFLLRHMTDDRRRDIGRILWKERAPNGTTGWAITLAENGSQYTLVGVNATGRLPISLNLNSDVTNPPMGPNYSALSVAVVARTEGSLAVVHRPTTMQVPMCEGPMELDLYALAPTGEPKPVSTGGYHCADFREGNPPTLECSLSYSVPTGSEASCNMGLMVGPTFLAQIAPTGTELVWNSPQAIAHARKWCPSKPRHYNSLEDVLCGRLRGVAQESIANELAKSRCADNYFYFVCLAQQETLRSALNADLPLQSL